MIVIIDILIFILLVKYYKMFITIDEEINIMEDDLLWEKVLNRIKEDVNSLVYATWFKHTKLKRISDSKYAILVPTEIHKEHLQNIYGDLIIDNLLKETDEVDEVKYALNNIDDFDEDLNYVPKHAKN